MSRKFLMFLFIFCWCLSNQAFADVAPWHPIGRYDHEPIRESSGFVASEQYEGVYWTLNDSGNPNVLYATRINGELIREFEVQGSTNRDWEALAIDDKGNLWVGEIGNNSRQRTDLRVYLVPEPNPDRDTHAKVTAVYPYKYPDLNVDAEGMFIYEGLPHIISKEADRAVLYRYTELDPDTNKVHVLDRVGELTGGAHRITGASISIDGTRLAACTYEGLWIYHADKKVSPEKLIAMPPWSLTHFFGVEANGFEGHDLILTSERRDIYRLTPSWYEQESPLPPRTIQPALGNPAHAESGVLKSETYKEAGVDISGTHLALNADEAGATLTWPVEISRADRYTIYALMTKGPEYGRIQLYADDQPVDVVFDAYAPKHSAGAYVTLGVAPLAKGPHELTLHVVGKSPASEGYKVGFDSYDLIPASPFPDAFYLLGPFDKPSQNDIDTPLPPEENLSLKRAFDGAGGERIQWQVVDAEDSGRLNIGSVFSDAPQHAIAYALVYVYSNSDRKADLLVGSDDQVAVWINGEEAHRKNVNRGARPDEDIVACKLKEGWNEVLCKIGQNGGGWGLYLRFDNFDGSLKYTLDPNK